MIVIGHRGARDLWPENSLDGFRRTLALGVGGVEFDIHPTTDGRFAVIHDATLDRTTEGSGPVAGFSSAGLGLVRLKGADEGIPILDDVLDLLVPAGVELHVELKADAEARPYPGMEAAVVDFFRRRGLGRQVVLTSFWPAVHEGLRALDPDIRLLASVNRASLDRLGGDLGALLDRLDAARVELIAVEKTLLAAEWDLLQRRCGPDRLGVWVVNGEAELAEWSRRPIRQVTTDRPDLAVRLCR